MDLFGKRPVIGHATERMGILQQNAKTVRHTLRLVAHHDFDIQPVRAGADHLDRLRMAMPRDKKHLARRGRCAPRERHGLACRRALVEQRCVRDIKPGQVSDHRLEIQDRLKPPLRDLGLVGRVSRVPRGIFQDVAQDDVGRVRAVVALPDIAAKDLVGRGDGLHFRQHVSLGARPREVERPGHADAGRDDLIHQRVKRRCANRSQHRRLVSGARPYVARDEFV